MALVNNLKDENRQLHTEFESLVGKKDVAEIVKMNEVMTLQGQKLKERYKSKIKNLI